jgi:hypothetical protein
MNFNFDSINMRNCVEGVKITSAREWSMRRISDRTESLTSWKALWCHWGWPGSLLKACGADSDWVNRRKLSTMSMIERGAMPRRVRLMSWLVFRNRCCCFEMNELMRRRWSSVGVSVVRSPLRWEKRTK